MGEFFSTVFSFFLRRFPGSLVSAYAILIVMFFLIWGIDHYGVISRIDTYFATGNMLRIAEAKKIYRDNNEAMNALNNMLDNEIKHRPIVESYWDIFSMKKDPISKRVPLYNTLSTFGFFVVFMFPLMLWTFFASSFKVKTSLTVEILSLLTIVFIFLAIVWVFQWATWIIPTIYGNNGLNYALNGVIQVVTIILFAKYIKNSNKQRQQEAADSRED